MLSAIKRIFQVTFECAHHYSTPPRYFSTAVKWCIFIIMKFQYFHMIFNTSHAGLNLTVLWGVLKIMWKYWNFMLMQIHHVTSVEKHLGGGGHDVHIRKWLENSCIVNFSNICESVPQFQGFSSQIPMSTIFFIACEMFFNICKM